MCGGVEPQGGKERGWRKNYSREWGQKELKEFWNFFLLDHHPSVKQYQSSFSPVLIFRFKWRLSWCWSFKSMLEWSSFAISKKKKKIIYVENISVGSSVLSPIFDIASFVGYDSVYSTIEWFSLFLALSILSDLGSLHRTSLYTTPSQY